MQQTRGVGWGGQGPGRRVAGRRVAASAPALVTSLPADGQQLQSGTIHRPGLPLSLIPYPGYAKQPHQRKRKTSTA